jgi:hypothetical protein
MNRFQFSILAVCLFSIPLFVKAQNLEQIGKGNPVNINGGVSLNQIFYASDGIVSRRDPYSYYGSGNLNVSIYGWSIPLTFSLSNRSATFQQPFNQYSIHPTYKSISGHLGYVSASYSPYTLNGHIFLGAAFDFAPEGNWSFSSLGGRFLRAVEPDSASSGQPAFTRIGYGAKAAYHSNGDVLDVTLFHAQDELTSIGYVPLDGKLTPQENLAFSVGFGKTMLTHFLLKAELAASALSADTRSPESGTNVLSKSFLYTSRLSSSLYKAMKASVDFQEDNFTIGFGFERIDPEYRTLGAYFFNNDLENITVNGTAAILNGRMSITASAGSQRNNLDKRKVSTMRRAVGSLNVNFAHSEKINLSASYSNFQTFTNIRSQFQRINQLTLYDNLDTLNFTQLSQSISFNVLYTIKSTTKTRSGIGFNLSSQRASDKQGDVRQNTGADFYNANLNYSLGLIPRGTSLSLSVNGTLNMTPVVESKTFGPTASVSHSFLNKKLRTSLSCAYNNSFSNDKLINMIFNVRLSGAVVFIKRHSLNLSVIALKRQSVTTEKSSKTFSEFTGTIGYSYSFAIKKELN